MISDEELVERAEKVVRSCGPMKEQEAHTQASRAMEAAAGGPRVFKNWLAYQQARTDFWRIRCEGINLGERLAKEIDRLAKDCSGDELERAMRRFVGFFRRALVGREYLDKVVTMRER